MKKKTVDHIIKFLRRGSISWDGRRDALNRARKKVFDGSKTLDGKAKSKFHWQCQKCRQWFKKVTDLEVDHIEEIGAFAGNWDDYINRMYCDDNPENLQVLCIPCHARKTSSNSTLRYQRKTRTEES